MITVISMVSVRFLMVNSFSKTSPTPIYTSSESQSEPE
jgi:hypothetical protein